MKTWIILAVLWAAPLVGQVDKRPYFTTLSPQEGKDIHYVVETLGTTSTVGLLFKKKTLEQAGERIEHVHPLRFLSYILSHPNLKSSFIQMRGMTWRRFEKGLTRSLQRAAARDNLNKDMIDDFAKRYHLDAAVMQRFVENKQWKSLIGFIRRQV